MRIRPCIDLRGGKVVQIVGGTLRDAGSDGDSGSGDTAVVNFATERPAAAYARRYRRDGLPGGHVIALGPGNEEAALSALRAFPGGMHFGGGVTPENARAYLDAGASHVIVTSYVMREGRVDADRLARMTRSVGPSRLVLDLSCRRREDGQYYVVTDRWQRFTDVPVDAATLDRLAAHCDEFLVHAADVEGKRQGVDLALVRLLADGSPIPITYAGGVRSLEDVEAVREQGAGRVDLTVGSALSLFGGSLPYRDLVGWQRRVSRGG